MRRRRLLPLAGLGQLRTARDQTDRGREMFRSRLALLIRETKMLTNLKPPRNRNYHVPHHRLAQLNRKTLAARSAEA